MSDTVIQVRNLGKEYTIKHQGATRYNTLRDILTAGTKAFFNNSTREKFWSLRDVSFDIRQGDRVGIIGRNGAGKSTLLKMLSRIVEPTTGKIQIKGRVSSLLEVGTGFHPELTGRENIFLNGAILGMSKVEIRSKFDEIIEFSEVEKFLDTPVKRYSSGMYVRLAFAIAAHLEPEVLIVDEVLAVGDAKFREKCLGKMKRVGEEGRTILFVSHQMGMLAQLCNHALMLDQGKLVRQGATQDVIAHYMDSLGYGNDSTYSASIEKTKDKPVYLSEIQTVNEEGMPTADFGHTDQITLKIKGAFNRYVENIMLSVSVKDRLERRVFTNRIHLDQWDISEHTSSFTATMKIPTDFLMPGKYLFMVLLSVPKVEIIDLVDHVCPLVITDLGSEAAMFEGKDIGCVFAKCEWLVKPEVMSYR
ncbi:polysaccharide ABC transporter ATP-binding protein [Myxacorys almedinensis]|uniref:ATP-binding cassette domain-containing protein n=1 Tax=Myxacorys almedinensis A TaxID=2690445 RepID=A0A8J7Z5W9_9CYAN|nr:polysaccharide ABC transporter ATP-binding protein [Myxacorys almedinensis]NDJ18751.1 ATP-binding cassette domain-containing protein [Myxacorys almedinensis A]